MGESALPFNLVALPLLISFHRSAQSSLSLTPRSYHPASAIFSFVRSFVGWFVRSFIRSFVRMYIERPSRTSGSKDVRLRIRADEKPCVPVYERREREREEQG